MEEEQALRPIPMEEVNSACFGAGQGCGRGGVQQEAPAEIRKLAQSSACRKHRKSDVEATVALLLFATHTL